jgi:ATP-dependent phosphofructokinase / diphosphate-dependent phosphofructokinase
MSNGRANAVIGQSGGPTAVINQSLVGVIEAVRQSRHIGNLLGARHGMRGIVSEDFIPLNDVPDDLLQRIAKTPAAALGSTRDKPDQEYCERIFKSFAKNDIQYFFYIGGNDSADTARIMNTLAEQADYPLQVFHIPKTIDNDLRVHDHTPGYPSAARFVAHAIMGDDFDNRSLPGIKVDVIMGRNAGYLTAASVLARRRDDDGPHLIYVPEAPVSQDKLLSDVETCYRKHGRCLIACSEGITDHDGKTWYEHLAEHQEHDMHGNIQLSGSGAIGDYLAEIIRRRLTPAGGKPPRVRADTFGYIQRSFPGCISEVDAREAREVGRMAVKFSEQERVDGSVAMRRLSDEPYRIEIFLTPLHTVAKETQPMDQKYVRNGNDISEDFKRYLSPLVGRMPEVGTFDEIFPRHKK